MLGEGYLVRNFGISCATMIKEGTDSGRPFGYAKLPAMKQAMDYNPDIVVITLGVTTVKVTTGRLTARISKWTIRK